METIESWGLKSCGDYGAFGYIFMRTLAATESWGLQSCGFRTMVAEPWVQRYGYGAVGTEPSRLQRCGDSRACRAAGTAVSGATGLWVQNCESRNIGTTQLRVRIIGHYSDVGIELYKYAVLDKFSPSTTQYPIHLSDRWILNVLCSVDD